QRRGPALRVGRGARSAGDRRVGDGRVRVARRRGVGGLVDRRRGLTGTSGPAGDREVRQVGEVGAAGTVGRLRRRGGLLLRGVELTLVEHLAAGDLFGRHLGEGAREVGGGDLHEVAPDRGGDRATGGGRAVHQDA